MDAVKETVSGTEAALLKLRERVERARDKTRNENARDHLDSALRHLEAAQGSLQLSYFDLEDGPTE